MVRHVDNSLSRDNIGNLQILKNQIGKSDSPSRESFRPPCWRPKRIVLQHKKGFVRALVPCGDCSPSLRKFHSLQDIASDIEAVLLRAAPKCLLELVGGARENPELPASSLRVSRQLKISCASADPSACTSEQLSDKAGIEGIPCSSTPL